MAVHLAQWLSPQFAVKVTDWVLRYLQGDITLVKDIVERHDAVHGTVSTVVIDSKEKDLEYDERVKALDERTKALEERTLVIQERRIAMVERLERMTFKDAQLYAAIKDDIMSVYNRKQIQAPSSDDITQNMDISELCRQAGYTSIPTKTLGKIGKAIAMKYRTLYNGKSPQKILKHVNGGLRPVKAYPLRENEWITKIICDHLQ